MSFGHAAFLGIGAYTTMLFYLSLGLSPWLGMLAGGVLGALFALPIGLICFRLRGPYFSLATLAVAEIVRLVALNWEQLTAGPVGLLITTLPPLSSSGGSVDWESKIPFYYIAAALTVFAIGADLCDVAFRLGAYLTAVREDIDSAEAVGIDTVRARVIALVLSAFVVGLARRLLRGLFPLHRSRRGVRDFALGGNGVHRGGRRACHHCRAGGRRARARHHRRDFPRAVCRSGT